MVNEAETTVPVTLKLSKQFYDKFGEQVANELVDAFNQVDATYRSDLKEMNESNFARFDAKQEARFAQFDAKLDARFAEFERRFAQFEANWDRRVADLQIAIMDRIDRQAAATTRLVVALWASLLIPIIGLWVR